MVNKTTKVSLQPLKPGTVQEFRPEFEVTKVEGVGKKTGDFCHVTLTPRTGGAHEFGVIQIRMSYVLTPGSGLASFAALAGQDPNKGFDPAKAVGTRLRLNLIRVL